MKNINSSLDVLTTGKLPQSEAEWLSLNDVEEVYINIDDTKLQSAVFTPSTEGNPNSAVFFVGGVPSDKTRRSKLPVVNKLFGYAASGVANAKTNPSYGISFNWPGQGKSEGDIMETSISSRTDTLLKMISIFTEKHGLTTVHLVGMSMGAYCTLLAYDRIDMPKVDSLSLLSPAAYPYTAHDTNYGQAFRETICSPWDVNQSPAKKIIERSSARTLISYFEHDTPPIPADIQDVYKKSALHNPNVRIHTIMGVMHNFRRPGTNQHSGNVVDNDAVRQFGEVLTDFITK